MVDCAVMKDPKASTSPASSPSQQPSSSPAVRYRVLRPHARGGLGEVFLAQDEELCREVALKEIRPDRADDPNSRRRFLLEAEITGALEHPGIVPVYGLGRHADGRPYYAMRFIQGETLKAAIDRHHGADAGQQDSSEKSLAFRELLGRFVVVCNAVAYAHSRGVIHRDLKPANVMLGKFGETLVVDWGLAKVADTSRPTAPSPGRAAEPESAAGDGADDGADDATLAYPGQGTPEPTRMGAAVGTPAFMSPEQAAGRLDQLGPASDIYSLGATLYALLTGQPPFRGADVLERVRQSDVVPARRVKADVPAALDAVCRKAMSLRPEDRYASALDLAAEIDHWLADEPVAAWPEPATVKVGRWARRNRPFVAGVAAALLVALIAGTAGLVWRQNEAARRQTEVAVRLQSARDALAQANQSHGELHQLLRKPGGVFVLLNDPSRWHASLQVANASLERAHALLADADAADPELANAVAALEAQVQTDDADRQLSLRLEKIRADKAVLVQGKTDYSRAARDYPKAFASAGLAVLDADPRAVAARIAASPVKEQLVAALDDWAWVDFEVGGKAHLDRLLQVARHASPDPAWGDRIRERAVWESRKLPDDLVDFPAARLSPQMLLLADFLVRFSNPDYERWLRDAQSQHPADFWLNIQFGNALAKGKAAEAEGFYRAAVAIRPGLGAAHNNLGTALYDQKRFADAAAAFAKAVELDPGDAVALANLGETYRELNRPEEALAALHKAIAIDSSDARAYYKIGLTLSGQNRAAEAIPLYEKALAIDANFALAHDARGVALFKLKRPADAVEAHQKAIALEPKRATSHFNLATALRAVKRTPEAVAAYETAIALDPKDPRFHNNLANALNDLGRADEAIAALQKALAIEPDNAFAQFNLGNILMNRGRLKEAVVALRRSAEISPKLPQAHGALGQALLRTGAFADAAKATQAALDIAPPAGPLRDQLAKQLASCRELLTRDNRLASVLAGQPATPQELLSLADLCREFGERNVSAVRLYQRAFEGDPLLADADRQPRLAAASAAARAGGGHGPEAAGLDGARRSKFRGQARDWLQSELDAHQPAVSDNDPAAVLRAADRFASWPATPDLAGVREPDALAALPPDESKAWQKFWADVREVQRQAADRFVETTHKGSLAVAEPRKIHTLKLNAEKIYVLDLESAAFDALLAVEDAAGKQLAQNDDRGPGDPNSRLTFRPKVDGQYRVVASAFQRGGTGAYVLRVREFQTKKSDR